MKRILILLTPGMFVLMTMVAEAATKGLCKFDTASLTFTGTAVNQASCLLRFVKKKATGSTPQAVPAVILDHVGKTVDIAGDKFTACVTAAGIDPATIGGALHDPVAGNVRYFVIHDTSSPELTGVTSFPANINDSAWCGNNLNAWTSLTGRVHVVVNRAGASRTVTKFSTPRTLPAVKLENTSQVPASRKRFIHVENIQPRIKPAGSWAHIAPDPGFSDMQLERLAWVYMAASMRARSWLIPAFHFNIDSNLYPGVDVHDDPQTFDLAAWGGKLSAIRTRCTAP